MATTWRDRPWHRAPVAVAIVAGVAFRIAVLRADAIGISDADEAVLELIAVRLQHGQAFAMYWGQAYGGTIEAIAAAAAFTVAGASAVVAKLVPTAFCAATALLVWRIGRRVLPAQSAAIAGALCWAAPAYLVYRSTNINIYFGALALATATLLLLQQLADGDTARWWPAAFGLAAGAAWWSSPQSAFLLLPAAIVYAIPMVRRWRLVAISLPFAVVGALPWVWWNVANDWASLRSPATDVTVPYVERVASFVPQLSLLAGLRELTTARWYAPAITRPFLAVAMVATIVVTVIAWRRRSQWPSWRVGAMAALFPLAYGLSPLSRFEGFTQPRYLTLFAPLLALITGGAIGWLGRRVSPWPALAATLAVVTASGLVLRTYEHRHLISFAGAPDALVPRHFGDLVTLFERHHVDYAYADYWIAFRATFEANEGTIVAPVQPWLTRYAPYGRRAEAGQHTALVTLTASTTSQLVPARLDALGVRYELARKGDFQLVIPEHTVARNDVVEAFLGHAS